MADANLAQRVYRKFSPEPLPPDRHEELYVKLDEARGNMDAVSRLERTIRFAEGKPTCQVLAGHKGSGKSTELFRLKSRLESRDRPLFVVYVEADAELDRNDVDFPDVLIAIVRQMAAQLNKRAEITLTPGFFKRCLERLKGILTQINFESFKLDLGLLELAGAIKSSPDARREIRKILEPDTNNLLSAANEVIGQAVSELTRQNKAGLVVLMDDLDKMIVRPREGTRSTTDEYLFLNRAAQLTAFQCHVIYTIPLSLVYSHHSQTIATNYGGQQVPVVPMTRVASRPPNDARYEPGVRKFREIIDRRLGAAGAEQGDVFISDQLLDELIALSGGQPTELMTLVREAIITHDLPIDEKSLERAKIDGRRGYARFLRAEHWPIIEEIRKSGDYKKTSENEPIFRELLHSRAVLQYVNEEEWYALNPMVAALHPPGQGIVT
jgi:hypothetical protein